MHNTTLITLQIEENVVEKLADLAGGESEFSKYLTKLIRKLHARKCGEGGTVDSDQLILEVNDLLEKQTLYEEIIQTLQDRLDRIFADGRVQIAIYRSLSYADARRASSILH